MKENYYISGNQEIAYNGWSITDYIELEPKSQYVVVGEITTYSAIYNSNKEYLSSSIPYNQISTNLNEITLSGFKILSTQLYDSTVYLRVSNSTSSLKKLKIYKIKEGFNGRILFYLNPQ